MVITEESIRDIFESFNDQQRHYRGAWGKRGVHPNILVDPAVYQYVETVEFLVRLGLLRIRAHVSGWWSVVLTVPLMVGE